MSELLLKVLIVFGPPVGALSLLAAGFAAGRKETIGEAIEAGHAEYYLDENNARQWRWLPPAAGEGAEK